MTVDGMPTPGEVRELGAALSDGWALAAFFALTETPVIALLGWLLIRCYREQVEDVRRGKNEYREVNPVLRELGLTLKAVEQRARSPEDSHLLRRVEELLEEIRTERGQGGR